MSLQGFSAHSTSSWLVTTGKSIRPCLWSLGSTARTMLVFLTGLWKELNRKWRHTKGPSSALSRLLLDSYYWKTVSLVIIVVLGSQVSPWWG